MSKDIAGEKNRKKYGINKIQFFFTKETYKSLKFAPLKYNAKMKIVKQYLI